MTVLALPDRFRPRIEVVRCRDRSSGSLFYVFNLVGVSRKLGPYRMDLAQRFTPEDAASEVRLWCGLGYEVDDREVPPT